MPDQRQLQHETADHPRREHALPVRAAGPGTGADALRTAYLDVLKLALCELAGTRTTQVAKDPDGEVMSRELGPDELWVRSDGLDWPLHGLTMAGLARLTDLQACVESVVADGVPGDFIEAGTWRGGSSMLMRATLDTLGDEARRVVVADSFQGFPDLEDEPEDMHLVGNDFLAVPLEEVRGNFARFGLERGVDFVPGFFEDTLASLRGRRWSIVRLDGDTYSATMTSLEALYPGLQQDGYLIVDDYGALDECKAAVHDFRDRNAITEPIETIDWTGARWRRRDAPDEPGTADSPPAYVPPPAVPVDRPADLRVRSVAEVILARAHEERTQELADLRGRLAAAESELEELRRATPRARLRRLLGRRGDRR